MGTLEMLVLWSSEYFLHWFVWRVELRHLVTWGPKAQKWSSWRKHFCEIHISSEFALSHNTTVCDFWHLFPAKCVHYMYWTFFKILSIIVEYLFCLNTNMYSEFNFPWNSSFTLKLFLWIILNVNIPLLGHYFKNIHHQNFFLPHFARKG